MGKSLLYTGNIVFEEYKYEHQRGTCTLTIGFPFSAIASKSEQLFEKVLVEIVKDMSVRIYAHMQKHCVGTISPPDFACIAHSLVHGDSKIDEQPDEVYDVDMDVDVPPSIVAKKNQVIPTIYKVNFIS